MEIIILSLLILSAIVFSFSFLKRDRVRELEKEVEQLSLSYMQDIYHLKKKISVLEEEFLFQDSPEFTAGKDWDVQKHTNKKNSVNEIIRNQVLSLYRQGLSIDRISLQSTLPAEEILSILEESEKKGHHR